MVEEKLEKKTLFAAAFGTVVEAFDFSLYGFFIPFIAPLFFPYSDQTKVLILTFSVFAAGFIMRPFGALYFGYFGDHLGRKKLLIISTILITIPMFVIALLPTVKTIGSLAALFMVITRIAQGLATGGEIPGATVYLAEVSPSHERGFYCSWVVFSISLGTVLTVAFAFLLSLFGNDNFLEWGWRIPFYFALIVGIVSLILRLKIPESPCFLEMQKRGARLKNPLAQLFCTHKLRLLQSICMVWVVASFVGVLFLFSSTFYIVYLNFPIARVFFFNLLNFVLLSIFIPIMGLVSDRIGRKYVFLMGVGALVIISYPLFYTMSHGSTLAIILTQICFAIFSSCSFSTFAVYVAELFPSNIRSSGVSIAINVAFAIFTGTGPLIAILLISYTGIIESPSFYLIFSGLISLVAVYKAEETASQPLKD